MTCVTAASATILIVDDQNQNRKLLEALLRPEGYLTRSAANGEEAMASIAEHAPDLILLDVMMPDMNGYEVASRLKADPVTANIPIIMVTALIDHAARVAGLNAGAEDFLPKPVDRSELSLRVRNLLRLKTLGDLLQKHNLRLEQEVQARVAELHLFRIAMDTTAEAIFLVSRSTMHFVQVNATACSMLGYTHDEFLEIGPPDIVGAALEDLTNEYDAIIAGPHAPGFAELLFRRKDGSRFPAELRRHVVRAGADWIIVGVVRDISEKKRAEAELLHYVEELKTAFMSTVEVATIISEMRDPYTAGHERRVAKIAVAIGAELGFDAHRQEGLQVAGHLHDIGKINIPAEILSRPGKLNAIEFMLIKGHAQASYDVLKGVKFPWPVADIALQHHERMDGSGYPQGLKGDEILLEARIMSVADVVEAMNSHRPYRPGLGIEAALAEIERGRETVYDPVVADACLRVFRQNGYQLPA
jgi:PAS domain S-box-containing protein